jgi:hypothetical protein
MDDVEDEAGYNKNIANILTKKHEKLEPTVVNEMESPWEI